MSDLVFAIVPMIYCVYLMRICLESRCEWRTIMSQTGFTPQAQTQRRGGRLWLRALLIGLALFVISTIVMFLTGNPNLFPTVILIGNFLIPFVFGAFLYSDTLICPLIV